MAERENMVYWKQNPKGGKHIMAKTLHPNQIHAISHGAGPMLVLAGPGSGKTTVIIQRIRRLTEKWVCPLSDIGHYLYESSGGTNENEICRFAGKWCDVRYIP